MDYYVYIFFWGTLILLLRFLLIVTKVTNEHPNGLKWANITKFAFPWPKGNKSLGWRLKPSTAAKKWPYLLVFPKSRKYILYLYHIGVYYYLVILIWVSQWIVPPILSYCHIFRLSRHNSALCRIVLLHMFVRNRFLNIY